MTLQAVVVHDIFLCLYSFRISYILQNIIKIYIDIGSTQPIHSPISSRHRHTNHPIFGHTDGWYMGGGAGMCSGGVAYGQAPPSGVGLAPPPVTLSSRIAVNMRNHRVVPYTSPTPRTSRTPPGETRPFSLVLIYRMFLFLFVYIYRAFLFSSVHRQVKLLFVCT